MKAAVRDWNKLCGKDVYANSPNSLTGGTGSLCGYESEKGIITRVRVAFAPGDWEDYPVEDVELVKAAT